MPASLVSMIRKPATSCETPTTVTSRAGIGGSSFGRVPGPGSCSSRNVPPTPLLFGQSCRAIDSETMATGCSPSRSAAVKDRPRTMSGLVGTFLGVESAPIRFERNGAKWSVNASSFVDMTAEGAKGLNPNSAEPMHLDNTGHPAADRFALARTSRSRVQALGLAWEDESGRNNGQYAPFSWRSA